jgi:hypothetical protein
MRITVLGFGESCSIGGRLISSMFKAESQKIKIVVKRADLEDLGWDLCPDRLYHIQGFL